MAEKDNTTIIAPTPIWQGTRGEQVYGDDLNNPAYNPTRKGAFGQQMIRYITTADYPTPDKVSTTLQTVTGNQTATASGFDFTSFFAQNKLIILGGLGLLGYFAFVRGGGGLAESTVVKRYATRK